MPAFETLRIWQEAHELMKEIHSISKNLPLEEKYRLRDQIERSSSSVVDNIAEGYSSYYYKEKIKGMLIARKELGETQNHLFSLKAKQYIPNSQFIQLINKYEKLLKGINGYVNYIRNKAGYRR
ncbi:MAG: four helix bundle protein [bacterium]